MPVDIEVRFIYPRVYDGPAQSATAFAQVSGEKIDGISNSRAEIVSGRRFQGFIGGWDAKVAGLGGWDLDVHRIYDPVSRTLAGGGGTHGTRRGT